MGKTKLLKFTGEFSLNLVLMGATAKIKNGFEPKICERCGRGFEWRKKWARDWENVKYCSEKCKR